METAHKHTVHDNYAEAADNSSGFSNLPNITYDDIQFMIPQVLQGAWDNLTVPLTEWQKSELINSEEYGVDCLLSMWFINQPNLPEATYCNATWDNFYCWPPSPTGTVVTRNCSEVLHATHPTFSHHIQGNAVRVCLENGTWLWKHWTNYTECADSLDEYVRKTEEERELVVAVQYILFIGSILSLVCLATALSIFYYFKCLWCDRVTVHIHLMVALMLRFTLLIIITEPFIFNRTNHYRNVDFVCKTVLSINLYATVASINWMFIQGVYLHGKLTTNVFDRGTPFKVYYTIGWLLPLVLITVYVATMETNHPVKCWKEYSDRSEIWILLGPMIFALLANLLFLINIMRILLTKVQRTNSSTDAVQFRRAVKATIVLFPLLGINNLLFLYNPGGEYNKFFVILNTIFGSTQGIFVSILYCFVSKDVRDAIRREYRRFTARRSANSMRRNHSRKRHDPAIGNAPNSFQTRTHFRTKLKTARPSDEASRSRVSGSPSPETVNQVLRSETPSPQSPYASYYNRNGNNHHNPLQLQQLQGNGGDNDAAGNAQANRYPVTIPLTDLQC